MTDRTYWIAMIDVVPVRREPDEPVGGVTWVIGAAPTAAAFQRAVACAPEFAGLEIAEWLELGPLEPGRTTDAFDGDAVVADLERHQRALFVDEIQWYVATDDDDEAERS